jgi:hypothetical protein
VLSADQFFGGNRRVAMAYPKITGFQSVWNGLAMPVIIPAIETKP